MSSFECHICGAVIINSLEDHDETCPFYQATEFDNQEKEDILRRTKE